MPDQPQTVADVVEQAAEELSQQMLDHYTLLAHAQGDRPPFTRARTMQEQAQQLLPDWLSHAPAATPDGEQWRESFVAQHGPDELLRFDAAMQRLYKDSRTSLEGTLHMSPEQAGHYFAATDAGLYQHHPSVNEQGGQADGTQPTA